MAQFNAEFCAGGGEFIGSVARTVICVQNSASPVFKQSFTEAVKEAGQLFIPIEGGVCHDPGAVVNE